MKCAALLLIALLLLSGCSEPAVELQQPEAPTSEETFFLESSISRNDSGWTEQELLMAFYQYAEKGTVVIDCVILDRSACDIVGVVQYTKGDETGCWFDYIDSKGFSRTGGVVASPEGEDTLICVGVDTVQCRLLDENGEEFVCEVTYFEESDHITTGFKIVGR